jgi:hypothetical protein
VEENSRSRNFRKKTYHLNACRSCTGTCSVPGKTVFGIVGDSKDNFNALTMKIVYSNISFSFDFLIAILPLYFFYRKIKY